MSPPPWAGGRELLPYCLKAQIFSILTDHKIWLIYTWMR